MDFSLELVESLMFGFTVKISKHYLIRSDDHL